MPLEQGLQTALLQAGEQLVGEPLFVRTPSTASTVVEARVTGLGLVPLEDNVRSSQFLLTAKANLIRTSDGQMVDERLFCYGSTQKPFFPRWADDDAKLFREELEKAHADIAEQVMAEGHRFVSSFTGGLERHRPTPEHATEKNAGLQYASG